MTEDSYRKAPSRPRPNEKKTKPRQVVYVSVAPHSLSVDDRIQWAIDTIREEMGRNNGVYPTSSRRPGIQEVLRRSGLRPSYLEAKRQNLERDRQQAMRKKSITDQLAVINSTEIQKEMSSASLSADPDEVAQLRQGWHETELELLNALNTIEILRAELREAKSYQNTRASMRRKTRGTLLGSDEE